MSNQPLCISISEAAALLGLTKQQLYELTRNRSRMRQRVPLPVLKIGKRRMFRRESLEQWLNELETSAVRQ